MALSMLVNGAVTTLQVARQLSTISLPLYLENITGCLMYVQDGNVMTLLQEKICRLRLAIFGKSLFVRNDLSWESFSFGSRSWLKDVSTLL